MSKAAVSVCDLKVASLIRGEFGPAVEDLLIIDCRYPYEYQGGHIKVLNLRKCNEMYKELDNYICTCAT